MCNQYLDTNTLVLLRCTCLYENYSGIVNFSLVKDWTVRHFSGQSAKPLILVSLFQNFGSYCIFLERNKLTSLLGIFTEYSADKKKSRSFKEIPLTGFPVKNKNDTR